MLGGRSVTGADMGLAGLFGLWRRVALGAWAFYRARRTEVSPPVERHFMSFRRAILGAALCCAATTAAPAQTTRQIEGAYEITFAGFSGFRINFTAKYTGDRYEFDSHVFKEGVLKAITLHYEGRNKAWGGFLPGRTQPTGGSLALVISGATRTWLAQYGAGGMTGETHTPEWKPTPQQ